MKINKVFIIIIIVISIFAILYVKRLDSNNYESVTKNNREGLNILTNQSFENNETRILILYRKDCQACKNVEKNIVRAIKSKQKSKNDYIVLNIQTMKSSQIKKLVNILPEILIDGNKIPTPLVAKVSLDKKGDLMVVEQSNTDDWNKIKLIMDR